MPFYLRKDARSGFHREAHAALPAHADPETLEGDLVQRRQVAQLGMSTSVDRRSALAAMFSHRPEPVMHLDPDSETLTLEDSSLALTPDIRLSLEIIDDRVAMILTTGRGQRRLLSLAEQGLIRTLGAGPTGTAWREQAERHGVEPTFIAEMAAAGVLVPA